MKLLSIQGWESTCEKTGEREEGWVGAELKDPRDPV